MVTLNISGSESGSPASMLQDSNLMDSLEMFLEDYFHGNLNQTELETCTNQIIGDLIHCMEDFLSSESLVNASDLELRMKV